MQERIKTTKYGVGVYEYSSASWIHGAKELFSDVKLSNINDRDETIDELFKQKNPVNNSLFVYTSVENFGDSFDLEVMVSPRGEKADGSEIDAEFVFANVAIDFSNQAISLYQVPPGEISIRLPEYEETTTTTNAGEEGEDTTLTIYYQVSE